MANDVHAFDKYAPSGTDESLLCKKCTRQCHSKVEFEYHNKFVDCTDFSQYFHLIVDDSQDGTQIGSLDDSVVSDLSEQLSIIDIDSPPDLH